MPGCNHLRGSNVSAGFTGIALVNMMDFSQLLASLVEFWTSLETSLAAVSRVKTFSENTPVEEQPTGGDTRGMAKPR